MINYSIFLQGNPLDASVHAKAYVKPQVSEVMSFAKFVRHIADHNWVFSEGIV